MFHSLTGKYSVNQNKAECQTKAKCKSASLKTSTLRLMACSFCIYCVFFIYKFQTINRDGAHTQFKQYCDSELFPSFLKATSAEAEVNELISKVGFMLPPTYSVIGYERNVTMLWNYSCSLSQANKTLNC